MPIDVHHSGPEAHRELAKKSLEDREILGHGCGIYPRFSRALRLIRGVGGTRGRLSESAPSWAADRVARHRTRRGSTWVDHVRPKGYVTRAGVTWDFRGGGRATGRGKSRGDGWDRYTACHLGCVPHHLLPVLSHATHGPMCCVAHHLCGVSHWPSMSVQVRGWVGVQGCVMV